MKPGKLKSSKKKTGRYKDEEMATSFQLLCSWLADQAEALTLPEIQEKMKSFSESGETNIVTWLEKKLQVKYKDLIYFSQITGMPTKSIFQRYGKPCFHMTGPGILKDNTSEENKCVITATANLILKEVRGMNVSSEYYPTI